MLGNVTGGLKLGWDYEGAASMSLSIDTQKAFGWKGGTLFASALQLHGRGLTADYLDNINTVSGIEAERTTRLWELWYQQAFAGDKANVRIGQLGIDQEFIVSQGASLYVNAEMGWPVLPAYDLYAGGPANPLYPPPFASKSSRTTASRSLRAYSTTTRREVRSTTIRSSATPKRPAPDST